jgi:Cytochrome P450
MVLYPEVQRKAQAEIDALVGNDRLPDFSDRPLLPYVSAVLEEALRWHPVVPLGTRHNSSCARLHIFDIAFIFIVFYFIFSLLAPSYPP